jgi:DNA replication and repair protein RecF
MNIVKSVKLTNFRSHDAFSLNCNKPTTLIIGENGSGKTSILEAIYLALRGKSFKATDPEIYKRGATFYRVEITFSDNTKTIVRYNGEYKEFEVTDKKSRRLSPKHKYPVVLFEPDNLHLIGSSPSRRRDYFDHLFAQMDETYNLALHRYAKALKQRNDLLKNSAATPDNVFSWDIMLARYGAELAAKRHSNVESINQQLTPIYREIARNQDECELHYHGTPKSENHYLKTLTDSFQKDLILGHTTFGIHRDDYLFEFNHVLADGSASRGEIRSLILALKFIEASILRNALGKDPLVLLDDTFSELDDTRQTHLINNFKNHQIIITSTTTPKNLPLDIKL